MLQTQGIILLLLCAKRTTPSLGEYGVDSASIGASGALLLPFLIIIFAQTSRFYFSGYTSANCSTKHGAEHGAKRTAERAGGAAERDAPERVAERGAAERDGGPRPARRRAAERQPAQRAAGAARPGTLGAPQAPAPERLLRRRPRRRTRPQSRPAALVKQ